MSWQAEILRPRVQTDKQPTHRLIQADDSRDQGRLTEAKGGVLAMTEQLSVVRYTIRNYIWCPGRCNVKKLNWSVEQENYRKCQRERNSSHPGCFEVAPLIKQERYRKNLAKLVHQSQRPFFMKSTTSNYNKVKKFN